MPAQPITLGDMHFKKKGDAVDYLKDMLARYDLGDRVSEPDSLLLKAALDTHPSAADKIGCGVDYFSVRTADYGTKCFWVNRLDGTTEKFSVTGCIYGS